MHEHLVPVSPGVGWERVCVSAVGGRNIIFGALGTLTALTSPSLPFIAVELVPSVTHGKQCQEPSTLSCTLSKQATLSVVGVVHHTPSPVFKVET